MTLPVPNLDDRDFATLVREAREHIRIHCPEWTDLSVHDPGMALVEVFAHLTEVLLYRLNRLPEKAYVEFLNLLGVQRHPPSAAWTELTFRRTRGGGTATDITIPAGTRIAAARGADPQPAVFTVLDSAVLPASAEEVSVVAHHCESVDGELLGVGTGAPGQAYTVARPPITSTTEPFDVLLGVQVSGGSLPEGAAAREYGGSTFEIWRPVVSFAEAGPTDKVYLISRATGTITFAPALDLRPGTGRATSLAAVPPAQREIRIWYRTGGGPAGNVAAGTLTSLRDPVAGVSVTNPAPARGGRALESIESALHRGPYELFALRRAVTARDFELLAAAGSAAIARAKTFTRTTMWTFARPGEVETVLVPQVSVADRPAGRLTAQTLASYQGEQVRARTQQELDTRRALGTRVVTTWARYKPVSVRARIVVRVEDDPDAIRDRIHDRLYQTISPLPTEHNPSGWQFGEPLRSSTVYRLLEQAEPGVRYVDDVRFVLDDAPDGRVRAVAADAYQPDTWYAGSDETLFRSTNGGRGWEPVGRFPGEGVRRVVAAPGGSRSGFVRRPGLVAAVTRAAATGNSGVHVSRDLGESWQRVADLEPAVADLAWVDRDGEALLLLATDAGLYELAPHPGAAPLQVRVDDGDAGRGFSAVQSFVSERGAVGVALAAQARYGVYLSLDGGRPGSFRHSGLSGIDVRSLVVQLDGAATVLWAGTAEPDANRSGDGCYRARLFEADVRWEQVGAGWAGGTCWALGFAGATLLAATQSGGVMALDVASRRPRWQPADVNGGLPLRDRNRFEPVETLGVGTGRLAIAGTPRGVYRAAIGPTTWAAAANRSTQDAVTVPETWLLCSGSHDIEVVRDAPTGY
ncbi:putative baseplate assembly protein [Solwaraspora sp. WMMB335]|uniref:putative baseplate assembly protein n=1 Tax=Solwaraspora sp. WMMB335 TaxID=3404118 RepID=UPI003B94BBAB